MEEVELTPAQKEVLALIALGRTDPQIASELKRSLHTIKSTAYALRARTGARNRVELLIYAMKYLKMNVTLKSEGSSYVTELPIPFSELYPEALVCGDRVFVHSQGKEYTEVNSYSVSIS